MFTNNTFVNCYLKTFTYFCVELTQALSTSYLGNSLDCQKMQGVKGKFPENNIIKLDLFWSIATELSIPFLPGILCLNIFTSNLISDERKLM